MQQTSRRRPRGALSAHRLYFLAAYQALRSHHIETEEQRLLDWLRRRLGLSGPVAAGLQRRAGQRTRERVAQAGPRLTPGTLLASAFGYAGTKDHLEPVDLRLLRSLRETLGEGLEELPPMPGEGLATGLEIPDLEGSCRDLSADLEADVVASLVAPLELSVPSTVRPLALWMRCRGLVAAGTLGFALGFLMA